MVKTWVWVLGISVAVVLASWGVMVLLAKRLPPGVLRDVAASLPA